MSTDQTDADRADAVRRRFDALVELAPAERAARLATIDDAALRQEVASLLDAYDGSDDTIAALDELRALLTRPVAADPHRLAGRRIRQYVVEAHLGGGGMGVVYRARDTRLGRTVALKFLPPHLGTNAEAKERFMREARAASALDHPNIGTIHEINETAPAFGTPGGRLFIAMAYYRGETLKAKIARGPLPVEEALDYATQVAEGLTRAHEAGIIHRDVKPANVIVTERGRVKLVDFGLAKMQDVSLTQAGQALGTIAYMSPEQARGNAVDARTDLWSLGVLLYEMLTGMRPFGGTRPEAVIYAIRHDNPAPIGPSRGGVPGALEAVIERCLEKHPDERYATAGAVLDDLRAVHANANVPSLSTVFRRVRLRPAVRRRIVSTAAILLILLGAVVSWALWSSGAGPIDAVAVLPLQAPLATRRKRTSPMG